MAKSCDHKSVGMLVWQSGKLLLIERGKPPFGFAPPAGHVDDDTLFEEAAGRELREEVGLESKELQLLTEGRKDNHCRREGGSWHYWKIYNVEASGDINRSKNETKGVDFYDLETLQSLAKRTEKYLKGDIPDSDWEKSPGLEPVWYEWFKELNIL